MSDRYFAAYYCPGGGCSYMGPDLPPDICPVHGGHAIADYAGKTVQLVTEGVSPDGWEHCGIHQTTTVESDTNAQPN